VADLARNTHSRMPWLSKRSSPTSSAVSARDPGDSSSMAKRSASAARANRLYPTGRRREGPAAPANSSASAP
jgi:hypothetical protein